MFCEAAAVSRSRQRGQNRKYFRFEAHLTADLRHSRMCEFYYLTVKVMFDLCVSELRVMYLCVCEGYFAKTAWI